MLLDDVFTMSDTARFARILNILSEVAQRMQVIVFTCHPERYSGIEGAKFFDIEAIKRDAG